VPTPAVIPAPRVYLKVVAVKTLVVHLRTDSNTRPDESLLEVFPLMLYRQVHIVYFYLVHGQATNYVGRLVGFWDYFEYQL